MEWEHPFKQMFLTTDLHTACIGAHEGSDGAVIITGTGSCGFSCVNGRTTNFGGHGFALGDKGSGAWMGLEAIKATLLDLDGLGEATNLTNVITEHFAADNAMAIVEKMSGQPSSSFAKLARYVFEAANNNDKVAVSIVKEGADYVSKLAQRLLENNPPRLSMIGGLAEPLNKWLAEDIAKRVESPIQPPEMGAVYFAQQSVLEQNQEVSL
jgi:glucosamine kinase